MDLYNCRTDGSYIDKKETTISWIYKDTDFELGKMMAKELVNRIKDCFDLLPI